VRPRLLLAAIVMALAVAAAVPGTGGAANECQRITACIPVAGPWVVVHRAAEADFLLSCGRRGVVGGLDALATTTGVRVAFEGRIGAPVSPGVTTTTSAYFRGVLVKGRLAAFQPWLGCIPAGSAGGRSTVSARVAPGPALDRRARIVVVSPGEVKTASIGCPVGEKLVGGWHAVAFRTRKPPDLTNAALVHVTRVVTPSRVVVTVLATDALSIDAHAVVQVGATCAP
jgi:hypothetical protein